VVLTVIGNWNRSNGPSLNPAITVQLLWCYSKIVHGSVWTPPPKVHLKFLNTSDFLLFPVDMLLCLDGEAFLSVSWYKNVSSGVACQTGKEVDVENDQYMSTVASMQYFYNVHVIFFVHTMSHLTCTSISHVHTSIRIVFY